ncbi:hypothetical protein MBLNU459_g1316t1 [Dothideomycetes sp. NU459]
MVVVSPALPALSGELALFHTTDPLLSNSPVLVFYGPAASISSTTSRIQVHVFTPAGLESYTRLAISPNSPYYNAVNALPREEQGDEVCRGLAFGLSKYFAEIPKPVKEAWIVQATAGKKAASAFALFSDPHIAILASRMNRVENVEDIIEDIQCALGEQSASWLDLDVVLPPGSIQTIDADEEDVEHDGVDEDELCVRRYGKYAPFVKMLGEPAFLPTSRLRRAPSKPTAIGRSQVFLRDQRETTRREMSELVDTEANYVSKIGTLVKEVAKDLREAARNTAIPITSPVERMVQELFPQTLDKILEINSAFLDAIRNTLDKTEEAAMRDFEDQTEETSRDVNISDAIGLTDFAKCLLEWFPKFAEDYPEYMRAHSRFPRLLRKVNKDANAVIVGKVQDIGEQRLTSMLIEPVQRLPRYTLYIDCIAKQLPVAHPALKLLLKARDIVSEICSQDAPGMQETNILERLQRLVKSWPTDIEDIGRLITITDVVELFPPYDAEQCRGSSGVLLLFTDCAIFLEKRGAHAMSARALLSELGKPLMDDRRDSSRPNTPPTLHFVDSFSLRDTMITEYLSHTAINLLPDSRGVGSGIVPEHRIYVLEGSYSGKASKFQEEWTKAQLEGRFSEEERESGKWEVRSAQTAGGELNLFNAIFEDCQRQHKDNFGDIAKIRVIIDPDRHEHHNKIGENGLEASVFLTSLGNGFWQIATEGALATATRDKVTEGEFLPVLIRRLSGLLQARFSNRNPAVINSAVLRNQQLLDEMALEFEKRGDSEGGIAPAESHERVHRPKSPVKMISNFLSSTHQPTSPRKMPHAPTTLTDAPVMLPLPTQPTSKPSSRDASRPSSQDQPVQKAMAPSQPPASLQSSISNPSFKRLETTLSTYLLALQARKGNIVGKIVQARSRANELYVNELYNSLLEDPNLMVLAAQASIDVLFAAFEKFLNAAWKDQIGVVVSVEQLRNIQSKAESMFVVDFEKYFKDFFHSMVPQNQRALRGLVKLLAELLDGTGNDSDRGILTAAFAEILVPEGDPYSFVSLIDRFVDDIESLFGDVVEVRELKPPAGHTGSSSGSVNSHTRSRSVNTGSLTSNTSSLRKKFGFGTLGRQDSKSEQDSKVGSVWRTLSKSTRNPDQPSSISRGTMQRAKSTEIDAHALLPRPASQDRFMGPASTPERERPRSQDASSALLPSSPLASIGEIASPQSAAASRRKRRSSLSDLKTLELSIGSSPLMSPSAMLKFIPSAQDNGSRFNTPLATPSRTTALRTPSRINSPLRDAQRSRLPSSFRMENSPATTKGLPTTPLRPIGTTKSSDEVTITSHNSTRRNDPSTGIPSLAPKTERSLPIPSPTRLGLSERPTAGNAMKLKPSPLPEKSFKPANNSTPTSTRKLRMQSPQKLRERLQDEQKATSTTQSSLQDELTRIGDEISALGPGRMGSVRGSKMLSPPSGQDLQGRLSALESSMTKSLAELQARITSISSDVTSSLSVSETKARRLDDLYREANAENEALYARFNDELARVLKTVRQGDGVVELKKQVKEGQEERDRLRRENARLKREVLGLRSQLKE